MEGCRVTFGGFHPATKEQSRLRAALVGVPGGGKTYTALRVATALADLVEAGSVPALLDTEHGSAKHYAHVFKFAHGTITDYHPERYIEAIRDAGDRFPVLIVDSLSHAWAGKGGVLEVVDRVAAADPKGNSFGAWREASPLHSDLIEAILESPAHVIVTMRAKTAYSQERDEAEGRTRIVKLGLAPIQRDGLEYEFDVVADLLVPAHDLVVTKTRCEALDGAVIRKAGPGLARTLFDWLTDGKALAISPAQRRELAALATAVRIPADAAGALIREVAGVETSAEIPAAKMPAVLAAFAAWTPPAETAAAA